MQNARQEKRPSSFLSSLRHSIETMVLTSQTAVAYEAARRERHARTGHYRICSHTGGTRCGKSMEHLHEKCYCLVRYPISTIAPSLHLDNGTIVADSSSVQGRPS